MKRSAVYPGLCSIVVLTAWVQAVRGQASKPAAVESYQKTVLPVLSKSCYTCHNTALNTADLNLEAFRDGDIALKQTAVWQKVLDKLKAGDMPPAGMPTPSKTELAAVTNWIQDLLGNSSGPLKEGDPGRVTARRLNRAEYNNTVRDLLGVFVKPADEFPVDDSGYGFDNIGDVLSLSPLLMEKYMATARTLSQIAVYGEPIPPKPTLLAVFMPKKGPSDTINSSNGIVVPYSIRGAAYAKFDFPVDAEYEFRVRVLNHRDRGTPDYDQPRPDPEARKKMLAAAVQEGAAPPQAGRGGGQAPAGAARRGGRGPRAPLTAEQMAARMEASRKAFPPVRMVAALDGKFVLDASIEGDTDYQYDRGAFIGRIRVKAGEHYLRASFPELADLVDPLRNINPDDRRRLYIEYMEIAGPFNPSPVPLESYKKIFICEEQTPACARKIVENLALRAYRRPVTQQEIDQLAGLVALAQKQGDTFKEGVRLAVQAILMSPNFLFRFETDPKPAAGSALPAHPINDYELASRLSYFLWGTMPDDELFRLAGERKLRGRGVLEGQVRRMLADPRASALVDNFAGQWLGIRNLELKPPDPARFPAVDDELIDYMHRETNLFVSAIIREDRSILDFIDAPFTYLNGPLARFYGIGGVKGEEFQRVGLDGSQRGGILTQGSILIASSYPTRTSVVTRGKWVLDNLLGTPPPPPPPDVPALKEGDIGSSASLREKMEQHRADPTCAVCHKQMDPIGFGLENYDASGAWRTLDGKFPIDASGTLPNGKSFNGARELKAILKSQSELFTRNLTEKLMTYAVGRGMEASDASTVSEIAADVASKGYRFSALVMDVVNSKPFQMRSQEGEHQ